MECTPPVILIRVHSQSAPPPNFLPHEPYYFLIDEPGLPFYAKILGSSTFTVEFLFGAEPELGLQ
jgi:hypothetical protein